MGRLHTALTCVPSTNSRRTSTHRRRCAWLAAAALSAAAGIAQAAWIPAGLLGGVATGAPAAIAMVPAREADNQAARWAPSHPLAVVRLIEPDKHAGKFRQYLTESGFYESPAFQLISSNPGLMQAQIGLLGLAATAGMDGWTAMGHVLGQDAVLGVYPGSVPGAKPGFLVVAVARDAQARTKFIDAAATAAGLMKGGKPDPDKSVAVGDRTIITAGDLRYCTDGDALLIASDAALIRSALSVKSGTGESLATSGELDEAEDAAPSDAMAFATMDVKWFVEAAKAEGKPTDGLIENPLGGFLFGGWVKSLVQADSAIAWMRDVTDGLSISALVDRGGPLPESHKGFAATFGDLAVDWSKVELPKEIMSISVSRDWASLFSDRESILTLPGASQAAAFAATMTTLMGNLDFLEDFLPRVNGPVHFFMERQDFTKGYIPTPIMPSFALVAPLKGGSEEMLKQRLMSGSQMAMSFINFDAAQKQQPGFLMGLAEHRGVSILKGTYPPPGSPAAGGDMMKKDAANGEEPEKSEPMKADAAMAKGPGEGVNIRYNFEPVVAIAKDHYLVATSLATMNALIDAVLDGKEVPGTGGPSPDELLIEGAQTTEILRENREELVVQRMLEQDEDRAQAERVIDAILSLTGKVDNVRLVSRATAKGQEATLTLSFKPGKLAAAAGGAPR